MTVEQIGKPQDAWNWLERYLDAKSVDESLRPRVRRIIEPAIELIARPPDQQTFQFAYPSDLTEQQASEVTASVQSVLEEVDGQRRETESRLLALVVELAVLIATDD